jgi:hypothetical protein
MIAACHYYCLVCFKLLGVLRDFPRMLPHKMGLQKWPCPELLKYSQRYQRTNPSRRHWPNKFDRNIACRLESRQSPLIHDMKAVPIDMNCSGGKFPCELKQHGM